MAQLTLTYAGRTVGVYELDRDNITIGRHPDNNIYIDNLLISAHHAVISHTDAGYSIEDKKSTNGTFVNETPIQTHFLSSGDVIRIGKHELIYNSLATANPPGSSIITPLSPGDTSGIMTEESSSYAAIKHLRPAAIKVLNGSRRGTELNLDHIRTKLGRPGKPGAIITRTPRGYIVNATEELTEILVNDQQLIEEHVLENRDVIEIAGFQVEFYYLA